MQIKINPKEHEKGSGSTSSITWENPYLLSALNTAFAVRSNERIASLEITPDGITARFESLSDGTWSRITVIMQGASSMEDEFTDAVMNTLISSAPASEPLLPESTCACVSWNASECYHLRHRSVDDLYRYADEDDGEKCECYCHDQGSNEDDY